jgi:hypothetical protein
MNGSERKPLTIAPTLPLTHRFSQKTPGRRADENKPERQADGEADRARDRRHHKRLPARRRSDARCRISALTLARTS